MLYKELFPFFAPVLIKVTCTSSTESQIRKKMFYLEAQEELGIFLCIITYRNFINKSWARNVQKNHTS